MDNDLIADFLTENFGTFQRFLDERNIEPTEAELIIDRLREE